jgi:glycerophosphoryl diester phosphodiesterase
VTLSLLRRGDAPLRIGHRGAAALAPENTLESFRHALELGVDGIEFDVVATPHGLGVAHEVGAPDTPPLHEALEFFAGRDTILLVDLKAHGQEEELVQALREHGLLERTLVSSFHLRSLRALQRIRPELPRSFTYPEDKLGIAKYRAMHHPIRGGLHVMRRLLPRRIGAMLTRADASALTLIHTVVTREIVEACHDRGVAVWAWTVNDAETAAALGAMGADAIITDDPRIFRDPSDS